MKPQTTFNWLIPLIAVLALITASKGVTGLVNIGQFIGFVVSFAVLTFFSLWYTVPLFRNLREETQVCKQTLLLQGKEA